MRTCPAWERIRTETGVKHRDGGFHLRVRKVRVKGGNLTGCQHAFIDDRLVGKTGDVEVRAAGHISIAEGVFGPPADDIELALEGQVILQRRTAADENLANAGLAGLRRVAEVAVVGRYVAPPEHRLTFLAHERLETLYAKLALRRVRRQKDHAHAILSRLRQLHADFRTGALQEGMRDL